MTKYTKNLLNVTAAIGMFLSAPVFAATSIHEVAENNSTTIKAQEVVEARMENAPALTANSIQEVAENNSTSIKSQEVVEARMENAPALTANSIQGVVEANKS
jgi:hypothetical protein